ncbi:MAG: SPW repeat protein [Patescibacteria group bacterium]
MSRRLFCRELDTCFILKEMSSNWFQLALGAWIMFSPWILGFSSITVMKWSNLIVGIVLVLINVWAIFGEKTTISNK